jgi:hypothetical protein
MVLSLLPEGGPQCHGLHLFYSGAPGIRGAEIDRFVAWYVFHPRFLLLQSADRDDSIHLQRALVLEEVRLILHLLPIFMRTKLQTASKRKMPYALQTNSSCDELEAVTTW